MAQRGDDGPTSSLPSVHPSVILAPSLHPGSAPSTAFGACWVGAGSSQGLYCVCKCESLKSEQKIFAVPDLLLVAFIGAARQEQDTSSDPGQFGGCRLMAELLCFPSLLHLLC